MVYNEICKWFKLGRRKERKDKKPLHTFGLNGRSKFRTFILSLPNEFS